MFAKNKYLLFAIVCIVSSPVCAQTQPPVTAPSNSIDDRVRQQARIPDERAREEAMLTGDTDIILTRPTRLFSVSGSADIIGTSNAFLSPTDRLADGFGQAQITFGIGTRLGGKVDVFANMGLTSVRYFRYRDLNYNAINGLVGARVGLGRLAITATYQPTIVLSGDFATRQLTTHRLKLAASLPFRLRKLTIEPSIGVERVLANPSDYRAWSGSAGLTFSAPLSKRIPIFAYATAQYEHRSFDAYFPDLVGVKRIDDNWSAGAGIVWRPKRWSDIRLSYSFQRNYSTSDVNGYFAHSGTLGLTASLRF